MPYTPNNWQTGDTIDATKLNHAEDGIAQAQQTADTANARDTLGEMTDVTLRSPTNGQVLTYDSTSSKWKNASPSGGASTLADLTDTNIVAPVGNQVLKYNQSSRKWKNADINIATVLMDDNGDLIYSDNSGIVNAYAYMDFLEVRGIPILEYYSDLLLRYATLTSIEENNGGSFTFKFGTISYTSDENGDMHRDT